MLRNDLVFLVNAANDESNAAVANEGSYPAGGVLALGTWINQQLPDVGVTVRDGQVRSTQNIIEEIEKAKPGLVGISVMCTSYENSLKIAQAAKDVGSVVVFGNDQASQSSRLILENRPQVDFVIGAEYGEFDLEMLIRHIRGEKMALSDIPTLTYRKNGEVAGFDYNNQEHKSKLAITRIKQMQEYFSGKVSRKTALDVFPIWDRSLFPKDHWESYLKNYLQRFGWMHDDEVLGVTTMNRARGCNRQLDDICKHCDMLLDISMSSAKKFWEEVRAANKQMNATSFYESCDSFSSFPGLIKSICEAKPHDLGFEPKFFVYCQAIDLVKHPDRIQMLKEIGVFRINMGLESMSDETLKHMKGPQDSVQANYKALELLKEEGIHVYGSFVLGSEKETPQTLAQTVSRVCDLIGKGYFADVEAQPVLPLYGNYQGRVLKKQSMMQIEGQPADWPLNVDLLSQRYVNNFSGVTYKQCIEAANIIRDCAKANQIGYCSGLSGKVNYQKK